MITKDEAIARQISSAINVKKIWGDVLFNVKEYGARGDGETNDTESINKAKSAAGVNPVYYPFGEYLYDGNKIEGPLFQYGSPVQANPYGNNPGGIRYEFTIGTRLEPSFDLKPIIYAEKYIGTSKADGAWDSGVAYFQFEKWEGDIFASALTGNAKHRGGSGQIIGVHGRGHGSHEEAEIFGMWAYATVWPSTAEENIRSAMGIESNVNNRGKDMGWMSNGGVGWSVGINAATADGGQPATQAVRVSRNTGAGWHTGFVVGSDAIVPIDGGGNNEAYRANGARTQADRYGGFRFFDGYFEYGIKMDETSFETNAIILGPGSSQSINFNNEFTMYSTGTNTVTLRTPTRAGVIRAWGDSGNVTFSRTSDNGLGKIQVGGGGTFEGPVRLGRFNVSELPGASSWIGAIAAVVNEAGGYAIVYSDGTDWRRIDNGNVVSAI